MRHDPGDPEVSLRPRPGRMPTVDLPLFAGDPPWLTNPVTEAEVAFATFHNANPQVVEKLEELAAPLYARGYRRIGLKMLYENARYDYLLTTDEADGFKLNNNHHALYARLLIHRHPEYRGVIELRAMSDGSGT